MGNLKLFIIAGVLIVAVIILLAVLVFRGGIGPGIDPGQGATLEFWGVFDDPSFYRGATSAFKVQNPNIKVNYREFSFEDYENRLIDAFAAGRGPDIWLMHNTWLPKHKDKIQPLTQKIMGEESLMSLRDFKNQFVDVAEQDLVSDNLIYSLPIYIDTLALYYNKDILNSIGISVPLATWDKLNSAVEKITVIDEQNKITQSAIAMGTVRNINRSTDILALLMFQSGLSIATQTGVQLSKTVNRKNVGEVALQYYTDFANPLKVLYTWNAQMDYSIDAFREGKTAMMINYSHHAQTLRSQAPRFNFEVAPIPQMNALQAANYANYWAPTVSRASKFPAESWKFLIFLSSREGASKYLNASARPPARRDLIDVLRDNIDLGVFAVQALSAKSWYQVDNDATEAILADMIDDINLSRRSLRDALRFAENQINTLIFKQRQK